MAFCSKCGYELRDGDVFCAQCGSACAEDIKLPEVDKTELDTTSVQMSAEDSIELADKLGCEYENLRLIREEISECQNDIRKNSSCQKLPRYSAFRFFWPFLIAAMVAFWVIFFVGCVIVTNASRYSDDIYGAEIAALIAAAAVLIVGGSIARNKRDSLNMDVVNQERLNSKKEHDLKIKLDDLKKQQIQIKKGVEEYNSIVPAVLRTKAAMNKVKMYIQGGHAKTFSEAIGLCISNR